MNTQEEYHKETGLYHYDSGSMDFKWNDEYVEWLEKRIEALTLTSVSKSFTYKDISKVAEELANDYSSDKKDPVWRDIRQDGIKAIQAFVSKHL